MIRRHSIPLPFSHTGGIRAVSLALAALGFVSPLFAGQTIAFPDTPLQVTTGSAPNLLLPISVEYPTVGSAYNGYSLGLFNSLMTEYMRAADARLAIWDLAPGGQLVYGTLSGGGAPNRRQFFRRVDSWFDPSREYVGYWRSDRCYDYSTTDGYFSESAIATNMRCSGTGSTGRWSGNFLNWSQTSAIDVLRLVMTGGHRYIDQPALTVLERAKMFTSPLRTFSWRGSGSRDVDHTESTQPIKEIGRRQSEIGTGILNVDPKLFTPFDRDVVRVLFWQDTFQVEGVTFANRNPPRNDRSFASYETLTLFPRVKVCDTTLGPALSNCATYAGGLKPTGEIQRRSSSMRFAAFGYLMADSATVDGGVLRASMRYTGPQAPTGTSGASAANPSAEWDADGVFKVNPDAAAEGNSGVINYLNKFGLSSESYKTRDNWGELYSESLRYLLGLQPKRESVSMRYSAAGVTKAKDGFPVATSWTDPIESVCQQSYILTIGDTNTHCDGRVPGMNELDTHTCDNVGYPTETITGVGGQPDVTVDAATWANRISPGLSTRSTGARGGTYAMAGLAYFANAQNVRPDKAQSDLRIKTYVIDVNEGSSIAFPDRAGWLAAKYGGFDDKTSPAVFPPVPDAGEWEKPSTIPGVPGGVQPKTFFLASDGRALRDSLQAAIADIASRGSGSNKLASSSSRITSTASGVFQTEMDAASWTGDLFRKNVSFASGALATGSVAWRAAALLTGDSSATPAIPATAPTSRKIFTFNGRAGVDFSWSAIPASFKTELKKPYTGQTTAQSDTEGAARLDWIRGDRSREAAPTNPLRKRVNLLGDSGNSSAVFVGKPGADGYDEKEYFEFARTKRSRQDAVYLGTSDGMLHAFNADTGREMFAYVPSQLHSRIAASPAKDYGRKPMVDATPTVVDAKLAGSSWGTVLVGGLGGGGKGIYALDVTDPANFDASKVLWEFTSADDSDVGNITSPPTITRLADGKHVVMFGSGYNNTSGDGYLFVLRLDRAAGTAWTAGTNYVKVKLTNNLTTANAGVSQPMASRDARGNANRVYLGDLDGNMHRVIVPPLTSGAVSFNASNWEKKTIFTASSSASTSQPITVAPALVFHPKGGVLVLFGTGKLMETVDRSALNIKNTFYAVWDNDNVATYPLTRSKLSGRTFIESGSKRTISTTTVAPRYDDPESTREYGWYTDLNSSSSERVTFPANVDVPENVDFTSSLGVATCSAGSGFYMSLDPVSGLMRTPSLDINADGRIDANDAFAGLATERPPEQVSVVKLDRPGDPYSAVSYVKFIGSKLRGVADPSGLGATMQKFASKYGRLNYRQITEIKR